MFEHPMRTIAQRPSRPPTGRGRAQAARTAAGRREPGGIGRGGVRPSRMQQTGAVPIARCQFPLRRSAGRARAARRDLEVGRQRRDGRDGAGRRRGRRRQDAAHARARRAAGRALARARRAMHRARRPRVAVRARSCRCCERCTARSTPPRLRRCSGPRARSSRRSCPSCTGPAPEPVGPRPLFEQLLGVFERLGDRVPTLLVLEDLHWADPSTRDLFVFLARTCTTRRVVLLGTYRSDDLTAAIRLRSVLAELDRSGAAERIDVERFDRDEVARV